MYLGVDNFEIQEYLKILSKDYPKFLEPYLKTEEMKRLMGISMVSASEHTKLLETKYFHTRYEHSIGVALIIWNFTKDKKQTLAGLFHDISTPSFSHVIDYLHGDYKKQETTEGLTKLFIENSVEIMQLLKKDNIKLEEVIDYKLYPIADNDSPRLSADRLEYTLSDGLVTQDAFTLESIDRIYSDLTILKNEDGIEEIGFKTQKIAEEYVERASKMWRLFSGNFENNIIMQFWTDILRKMFKEGYITEEDLYKYSEKEIVKKIEKCSNEEIQNAYKIFANASKIIRTNKKIENQYCITLKIKVRYTNPLVEDEIGGAKRISEISSKGRQIIEEIRNFKESSKYACLDLNLESTIK